MDISKLLTAPSQEKVQSRYKFCEERLKTEPPEFVAELERRAQEEYGPGYGRMENPGELGNKFDDLSRLIASVLAMMTGFAINVVASGPGSDGVIGVTSITELPPKLSSASKPDLSEYLGAQKMEKFDNVFCDHAKNIFSEDAIKRRIWKDPSSPPKVVPKVEGQNNGQPATSSSASAVLPSPSLPPPVVSTSSGFTASDPVPSPHQSSSITTTTSSISLPNEVAANVRQEDRYDTGQKSKKKKRTRLGSSSNYGLYGEAFSFLMLIRIRNAGDDRLSSGRRDA
ncbi:hypothetical protein L218DRAFT_1024363 [Marasmius fiardii PR-910]|nr:hypothetical protein L218DRAFT_1024363 [Marasmius fiardii PR-910]